MSIAAISYAIDIVLATCRIPSYDLSLGIAMSNLYYAYASHRAFHQSTQHSDEIDLFCQVCYDYSKCLCFEQDHSFMASGKPNGGDSTKTSISAAPSTA